MGFFYYYSVRDNGVQDWGAQDNMLWGRVQDCLWAGARKLVSGAGRESLFPVRGAQACFRCGARKLVSGAGRENTQDFFEFR